MSSDDKSTAFLFCFDGVRKLFFRFYSDFLSDSIELKQKDELEFLDFSEELRSLGYSFFIGF